MCLYVYYHGNNLHRFGFVRGALPTEEERNKGLNYGDILNQLSESDQEYFKSGGFSNYERIASTINIQKEIENRGIVSRDELHKDADINTRSAVSLLDRMSPYDRQVYAEMRAAEQESRAFDKAHGLKRSYEMMDDDIDVGDYFDMNLFDELNS